MKPSTKIQYLSHLLLLSGMVLFSGNCDNPEEDPSGITGQLPSVDSSAVAGLPGDELAGIYCGSCHRFPEPALLDKATWREQVLPAMSYRLGIREGGESPLRHMSPEETRMILAAGLFPPRPVLAEESWRRIVDYYLREAPDTLTGPPAAELRPLAGFRPETVDLQIDGPALTTMTLWQPRDSLLYIGGGWPGVFAVSPGAKSRRRWDSNRGIVDLQAGNAGDYYLLSIGSVLPKELPLGTLTHIDGQGKVTTMLENLPRPVAMRFGDLNGDGMEDIVISGFGYYTGQLAWYEGQADGQFTEHVLLHVPGAMQHYLLDLNEDGKTDILVLMAQGDESVLAFFNEGGGRFRRETLLRFPPVYGSAWLEPLDYDGDGDTDLLYVNGDNTDYSFIAKPYHGIRLFRNDGNNHFEEAFFYPLHGAYKAQCRDFDGDGDLDIAAIAFFADVVPQSPTNFLFLENRGGFQFTARTFAAANHHRWLTMTAGDFNGDSRPDIALGAFNISPERMSATQWQALQRDSVDVMVLWNEGR